MNSRQIKDFCSSDTTNTSSIRVCSPHPVNGDWLIFEVLRRLPVKTLVRFKTVCKRWRSLIQKDQNFIHSHLLLNRFRVRHLFIVNPLPYNAEKKKKVYGEIHPMDTWPHEEMYVTAELILFEGDDDDNVLVYADTVREVDSTDYNRISNPVNGLICLIDSHYKYAVRICNISTGELSPWFESSLLSGEKERDGIPCKRMQHNLNREPSYQFGFDPSTNQHKLVCLWDVFSEGLQYLICEVLTVGRQGINGDTKWRRIEEVPDVSPWELGEDSVYVNGVIYWCSCDLNVGAWKSEYRPIFIVAFDVGREKFRNITVSDFILDQPPYRFQGEYNPLDSPSYYRQCEYVILLEVSGRLGMLVRMNNCMFKMYIYEDDDYKLEEEINKTPIGSNGCFPSKSVERWSQASSFTLPFNLEKCGVRFCKFVGSDDEIILAQSERPDCYKEVGKKKCVSFYSYNWKKGNLREFEVSGIPSSVPHLCTGSFVTTFLENLLPINDDKDQTSSSL